MNAPSIVACVVALFFFLSGCLQMAMHIGQTPTDPLEPFMSGLMTAAWPLGVAAIIFALLDIRTAQSRPRQMTLEDDEIPEAPVRRVVPPAPPREEPAPTYFNMAGMSTTVAEPQVDVVPPSSAPVGNAMQAPYPDVIPTPPPFTPAGQYAATMPPPAAGATRAITVPLDRLGEAAPRESAAPAPQPAQQEPQEKSGLSFFKV